MRLVKFAMEALQLRNGFNKRNAEHVVRVDYLLGGAPAVLQVKRNAAALRERVV